MGEPDAFQVPVGRYTLNTVSGRLSGDGKSVQLSPLAAQFLAILSRFPGDVVERSLLIDALWRGDYLVGDPALNRLVSETRKAVGDDPRRPTLIQTVPRQGYRLVAPSAAAIESEPTENPAAIEQSLVKLPNALNLSPAARRFAYGLLAAAVGFVLIKLLIDELMPLFWMAGLR